jgi:hypothetical protein
LLQQEYCSECSKLELSTAIRLAKALAGGMKKPPVTQAFEDKWPNPGLEQLDAKVLACILEAFDIQRDIVVEAAIT